MWLPWLCREKSRYELAYEDYAEYPEAPSAAAEEEEEEASTKPDDRNLQKSLSTLLDGQNIAMSDPILKKTLDVMMKEYANAAITCNINF